MPEMIPVGNTGIQPDPLGSISKMIGLRSGMIGLQQQQQNLQTGQSTQQSAQAKAQVDTQNAAQFQALGNFTRSAINSPSYYDNADPNTGNFLSDKFRRDASQVAPNQQPQIEEALNTANQAVTNKKAVLSLGNEQRKTAAGFYAALAGKTDASPDDVNEVYERARAIDPNNPQWIAGLNNMNQHFGAARTAQDRQQIASGAASELAGQSPLTSAMNAAGQFQTANTLTTARTKTPTAPGITNPTTPEVAGAAARQTGTAGSDIDRANQVSGLQQQAAAAIPLTQRIDQLSDDINSGKVAKMISETGNYFSISSINEARSQLNKDLGQVKALAIQNAGSDSRAGTILEGYPTDTTPAQTTHAAMDYIRGTARQNLARGQLLQQYQAAGNGNKGFQAADSMLTSTSNPLMHEFMALPPAQRAGFYTRNFSTPQEAQAFKDQVGAMQRHTTGIVNGGQ